MDQATEQNLLNLVKNNYREIALDFNETRKKPLWPELIKLTGEVKNGDTVLDVGCGNGRLSSAFQGKNIKKPKAFCMVGNLNSLTIEYLGVDNSEELINTCSPRSQSREGGNLIEKTTRAYKPQDVNNINCEFIIGDMLELNKIPKNNFNYIFSIAALHHIPGKNLQIKALDEMKKKLAPDGKIIFSVWDLWRNTKYLKLIIKYAILKLVGRNKMDFGDILFDWKNSRGENISQRYYHAFTKNELKNIIKRAGLAVDKLYGDGKNYYVIAKKI
jgi:SAM-dependent methyltransferase